MKLSILDTDILSEFLRGNSKVIDTDHFKRIKRLEIDNWIKVVKSAGIKLE